LTSDADNGGVPARTAGCGDGGFFTLLKTNSVGGMELKSRK
jgi:hypothetical protein